MIKSGRDDFTFYSFALLQCRNRDDFERKYAY